MAEKNRDTIPLKLELEEAELKLSNIETFIEVNPNFEKLNSNGKRLALKHLACLKNYKEVLEERIEYYSK